MFAVSARGSSASELEPEHSVLLADGRHSGPVP
jgi:hypothetical protein